MEASRPTRLCRWGSTNIKPADSRYDRGTSGGQVSDLRTNRGAGYNIHLEHILSDRPGSLVDLVLVTIDR